MFCEIAMSPHQGGMHAGSFFLSNYSSRNPPYIQLMSYALKVESDYNIEIYKIKD
jgi:hypothetical protein